jgi:hypothetical protein
MAKVTVWSGTACGVLLRWMHVDSFDESIDWCFLNKMVWAMMLNGLRRRDTRRQWSYWNQRLNECHTAAPPTTSGLIIHFIFNFCFFLVLNDDIIHVITIFYICPWCSILEVIRFGRRRTPKRQDAKRDALPIILDAATPRRKYYWCRGTTFTSDP